MEPRKDHTNGKWQLLSSGNEKDMLQCFDGIYDDLYRLGLFLYKDPALVKESIHLTFIEIWKIREKFEEVTNIRQYVITIYKRVLFKQKAGAARNWSSLEALDTIEPERWQSDAYDDIMISHQEDSLRRNKLAAVLKELPERQKDLIRMRYLEEMSIDEIVKCTGLTARTVYNTLHNAIGRLKQLLG